MPATTMGLVPLGSVFQTFVMSRHSSALNTHEAFLTLRDGLYEDPGRVPVVSNGPDSELPFIQFKPEYFVFVSNPFEDSLTF